MIVCRFAKQIMTSYVRTRFFHKIIGLNLSLLLALGPLTFTSLAVVPASDESVDQPAQLPPAQIQEKLSKQPLYFEVNAGQVGQQIKFISHGGGRSFLLTNNGIELNTPPRGTRLGSREEFINRHALLRRQTSDISRHTTPDRHSPIRLQFAQANTNPRVEGQDPLLSKSHYLIGMETRQWRRDIAHYAKVKYDDLYPGIDLIYYGNQQQLEYDFVVAPRIDPNQIKLAISGAQNVRLAENGDLILTGNSESLIQQKPVVYQEIAGIKRTIEGRYKLLGHNLVGFELGTYDSSYPLVIDPILGFATTFGTADDTIGNGVATDLAGNSYITGIAYSVPSVPIGRGGIANVFVTKLNVAGQLVYNTYIGSNGEDTGLAIDVDSNGNAYVTGQTTTNTFPVTNRAFQRQSGGLLEAFVFKLNRSGSELIYSTFLGGSRDDAGTGIAVDRNENAYVAGETTSLNFPTVAPIYRFGQAPTEAFVCKVSSNGSNLIYSTALTGATTNPQGGSAAMGIDVNRRGDAVVAGFTTAEGFPKVNAVQANLNGTIDAFIARINRNGNRLDFSTYLGGSGEDAAYAVAMDAAENVYITGLTNSTDYPTINALQSFLGGTSVSTISPELTPPAPTGRDDAFVTKLFLTGSAVVYSTYLGGSRDDAGFGIAVNNAGQAHVVGRTYSTDFPTEDTSSAATARLNGTIDAFASKLSTSGRFLVYSLYLGGNGEERGFGTAVWQNRVAYYTGLTTSTGWIANNLAPPKLSGAASAFAIQLISRANFTINSVSGASYQGGVLACDSIVSVFGEGISSGTEAAESVPLPKELGGIKVVVKDSAGAEFQAQLFYVSPYQINYHVPKEAALGPATVQIINENGDVFTENTRIEATAPGLFTADASGKGLVAGYVTRVKAGKVIGDEPIMRLNAKGQWEAVPIDLGAEDEELYLVFFGTGIRHRNPTGLVAAKIADADASVLYAGQQSDFVGLDQVNLRLPRSLKGRGVCPIVLTIDGKAVNTVHIQVK